MGMTLTFPEEEGTQSGHFNLQPFKGLDFGFQSGPIAFNGNNQNFDFQQQEQIVLE